MQRPKRESESGDLKKRLWQQIANLFTGGSPNDCQKSWENLRRSLANSRNNFAKKYGVSGSAGREYKPYKYELLMSFLDSFHGRDIMDGNLDGGDCDAGNNVNNDFEAGEDDESEEHDEDDEHDGSATDFKDGSEIGSLTTDLYEGSFSETVLEGKVSGIKIRNQPSNCASRKLFISPPSAYKLKPLSELDSPEGKRARMMSPFISPSYNLLGKENLKPKEIRQKSQTISLLDSPNVKKILLSKTIKKAVVQKRVELKVPIEGQQARKDRLKMDKQKRIADNRSDLVQKLAVEVEKAEKSKEQQNDGSRDVASNSVDDLILRELLKEEDSVSLFLASLRDCAKRLPPNIFRTFQIQVLQLLTDLEQKSKVQEKVQLSGIESDQDLFKLSEKMLKEVEAAWDVHADSQCIVIGEYCLYGRDLHTLRDGGLLNDQIVNSYFHLVAARGFHGKSIDTYFSPNLGKKPLDELKEWASNLKQYSYLLVPVHHPTNHWAMIFVNVNCTSLHYLDSMGGDCQDGLVKLKEFLVEETGICDWHIEQSKNIPRQLNSTDCGVFVCMYANFLAASKEFSFSQSDMGSIRRRMVYEICHAQLLPLP
ncbi:Sentrin-specific protease 2 [Frankliniella fusca]|uniref:Sentrin-specific protease 2 n=1 Tax=Frankliniella fusca TaxID=407009 RepID=A0AAE1LJX3_9NEOP|nr:Sentrin-specific protease 2 [Frankliniella fusca]